MLKTSVFVASSMLMLALSAGPSLASGAQLCNSAFPGALKVCHPMGTAPAGVVSLGDGLRLVVLSPFSGWKTVKAGDNPALAVFNNGKLVSVDRQFPYFENVQSVQVTHGPSGEYEVMIHAYKGGDAPDRYFTMTVHVSADGKIALQH